VARRDEEPEGPVIELTGSLDEEPGLETRTTLFRIAQEAIGNARRHAGAGLITVHLASVEGGVVLRVTDDGRGMDPDLVRHPRHGHLGLVAMRERAELAGGTFAVASQPGAGTTIEAWLPVGPSQPADDLAAPIAR
jgi:signal transduction histidine kinase